MRCLTEVGPGCLVLSHVNKAALRQQPDVSVVAPTKTPARKARQRSWCGPVRRRSVTARPSGRLGGERGYTQWTSTLVTLASSMVPLALATVHTWTGLVGWVFTRTWQGFPLTSVGKLKVKGPVGRAAQGGGGWRSGRALSGQFQHQPEPDQARHRAPDGEAGAWGEVFQAVGLDDDHHARGQQRYRCAVGRGPRHAQQLQGERARLAALEDLAP